MKYNLNLFIDEKKKEDLLKILSPYTGLLGRAKVFCSQEKNGVMVKIEAEDISSLRAAINSLTNALKVFENSKKLAGVKND